MRSDTFQLIIISPERRIFSGKVSSMVAPGISGLFGIFPDHAPMITALKNGNISYRKDGEEHHIGTNGGIVEVKDNIVTICIQ